MKRAAALLLMTAPVLAYGGGPGVAAPGPPALREIEMRTFAFVPTRVELSVGDTVVWVNRDAAPHTATDSLGGWDSGDLASGERWRWVADEVGVHRVLCAYHPAMRATLVVGTSPRSPPLR